MLQHERFEKILKQLQIYKAVKVVDLARELHTSQSTIRRDINELDKMGKLKKVFGGAIALGSVFISDEADVQTKTGMRSEEKDAIAKYAATLIAEDDFVYLDAGTTTERMLPYVPVEGVTYVTNGISHAHQLMRRGCRVYIVGGELKNSTEAVVGPEAVSSIRKYNFTKCFMGTNGIDMNRGFTTPDIEESLIKIQVIERSLATYILADSSKFGMISSVTFADINAASIITDKLPVPAYTGYTMVKEVEA